MVFAGEEHSSEDVVVGVQGGEVLEEVRFTVDDQPRAAVTLKHHRRHYTIPETCLKLYYDFNWSVLEIICSKRLLGRYCHPNCVCYLV